MQSLTHSVIMILCVYKVDTYMIKEITQEKLMEKHVESVQSDWGVVQQSVMIVSCFGIGGIFIP